MKKITGLILAFLLMASVMPSALSAQYKDVNWLYADWEINGYPDDVGGVYSYDGDPTHLCILIVGDDGKREAEITGMLENSENVRFGSAVYSYNELLAARDEITGKYMNEEYGITSCGVVVNSSGDALVVSVEVSESKSSETALMLEEKYGDMVSVHGDGSDVTDTEAGSDETAADTGSDAGNGGGTQDSPMYTVIYIVLTLLAVLLIAFRRKSRGK